MIDVTRVKKTSGGQEVRIYATDGGSKYPIHGARLESGHTWIAETWNERGQHREHVKGSHDLIEEPETVEIDYWQSIYQRADGSIEIGYGRFMSRTEALSQEYELPRIACINMKRTITKGEGL